MNEITLVEELVENTKQLLNAVRGSLIRVAQNLYTIKEGLEPGTDFGKFVEEEFGISQSFASKLLTVNRVYILEGGMHPEALEGIDYERLYLAKDLEGSPEEKVSKARVLTRRELREEKHEEDGHAHEWIEICKKCSIRNHAETVSN